MTFSQPLPICDSCREDNHERCAERGWDHDGTDVRVCWCVKCSWHSEGAGDA